jgi:hypothetical protein
MFSHYSSFIPLVLVLFVWGRFVVQSVTVTNILTKISKMAFKKCFFFALTCNFFDEMNTSVHESKCFDLIFAKRKMMGSCKILSQYIGFPIITWVTINIFVHLIFRTSVHFFSCVASSNQVGVLLHFLACLTTIGIHTILFLIINPFTD